MDGAGRGCMSFFEGKCFIRGFVFWLVFVFYFRIGVIAFVSGK